MKKITTLTCFSLALLCLVHASIAQDTVWLDDFNGTQLDTSFWTYDIGTGSNGWGNSELEYYTSRTQNVRVENGHLVIEAHRENYNGSSFTSGRIKTKDKKYFQYGSLEARIKIPNCQVGLWPAFWTMGNVNLPWAQCGEMDIMEFGEGSDTNLINKKVFAAVHWDNTGHAYQSGNWISPVRLDTNYHIYKLVWTATGIQAFVDNTSVFQFLIGGASQEEFQYYHYILLNLAVEAHFPKYSILRV